MEQGLEGWTLEEARRIGVMEQVVGNIITAGQAAKQLGIARRQVFRLKKAMKKRGPKGLRHGNKGRSPANKTKAEVKRKALEIFSDWRRECDEAPNASHFCDILVANKIKVSRQTTWRWLRERGAISSPIRKKKHRIKRPRRLREGEMLFLDGSEHNWYGNDNHKATLMICSDDATTKALWGVFVPQEDRNSCFEVAYEITTRFGLPCSFYLDRASQFITTRTRPVPELLPPTHWQVAMRQLGIRCIFGNSPQARGRGERVNGTFQKRLVHELQYNGIEDHRTATNYLNSVFIPNYNKRFSVVAGVPDPAWRKPPVGVDIRTILCARHQREVSNDNTVLFENRRFQILKHPGWQSFAQKTVEVQEWYDGSLHIFHPKAGLLRAKEIPRIKYKRFEGSDRIAATIG